MIICSTQSGNKWKSKQKIKNAQIQNYCPFSMAGPKKLVNWSYFANSNVKFIRENFMEKTYLFLKKLFL